MDLTDYREKINAIDDRILALFLQRMDLAAQVAAYKKANGLPVLHPAREQAVLERISAGLEAPMDEYARQLFAQLMALSRAYQQQLGAEDRP